MSKRSEVEGDADLHAVRVASPHPRLPTNSEVAGLADVFALLGDPTRLRLMLLLQDAELCVSDLAAAASQSESTVSHALRLLRAHRVVHVRRAGRHAYYRLADEHVRLLLTVAVAHVTHEAPLRAVSLVQPTPRRQRVPP